LGLAVKRACFTGGRIAKPPLFGQHVPDGTDHDALFGQPPAGQPAGTQDAGDPDRMITNCTDMATLKSPMS